MTIVGDEGWQPELATKDAVLERALAMMGGDRSSGLAAYHTVDGALRFVPRWPASGAGPHARDQERLRLAKRVALAGLAREE
ncbi:MAG: hypothetical protein AAGF11_45265 [Myxococcota bacterium]